MKNVRVLAFLLILIFLKLTPNNGVAAPHNDVVYQAQNKLLELGYHPGPSDGILGKRTRAALIRFQRDHRLSATGVLDKETLHQLQSSNPPQSPQDQHANIAVGDKQTPIQHEPSGLAAPPDNRRPDRDHPETTMLDQAEPTRTSARRRQGSRPTPRDPRLNGTWGFVSPAGCYWECQRSPGCYDGDKDGVAVTAHKGSRRGVDAQRVYRHPGWVQVCD